MQESRPHKTLFQMASISYHGDRVDAAAPRALPELIPFAPSVSTDFDFVATQSDDNLHCCSFAGSPGQ
jgi:hypothetical protein